MPDLAALARLIPLENLAFDPTAPPARITGVAGAARALLCAAVARHSAGLVVAVSEREADALALAADIAVLNPGINTLCFSPGAPDAAARLAAVIAARPAVLAVTDEQLHGPAPVIAAAPAALTLTVGTRLQPAELVQWLEGHGWERTDLVAEPGEYAARGGIVDLFPDTAELPLRIEFGPEAVESLRSFEPLTQRSTAALTRAEVTDRRPPARADHPLAAVIPADAFVIADAGCTALPPRLVIESSAGAGLDLGFRPAPVYLGNLNLLRSQIDAAAGEWLIACAADHQLERLRRLLGPRVSFAAAPLSRGFIHEPSGLTLLTERELYGAPLRRTARRRFRGLPLDNLVALRPGDLVVHIDYGIGRFEGTRRITAAGVEKDYLVVGYADGDRVYVPVENIGLLDRYVGAEDASPRLDRLGGRAWLQAKARAARSSAEYAGELLDIYARRLVAGGIAFPPDDAWSESVAAAFPFEETPDQLAALAAVRADMERARPMDRLICGDVGYGKTEIALRAAVKAVAGTRQVALLAPTTILCWQHYSIFRRRLRDLPVQVALLSRIAGSDAQKATLRGLADGTIDIVIGTHRLLDPQVRFRDLGLVIIDEEQRFGVRQKERFKALRASVDVLTLTATPIPRTLYMALAGLRDISQLNTPPPGRRDILTEVAPDSDGLIRDYIHRELNRGGQVFFVHNEIRDLDRVSQRLTRLVPEARLLTAHGRLSGRALARIYSEFAAGKADILLCTAIIESGVDLPNVNTIIVDRADRFGLADLHQLRGRVGRSEQQAWALFLVPTDDNITADARQRLSALAAYSRLGSGYRLALRDMEIRGVGNLLGTEQHGHVARIGFNLYARMLREAVARQKGETVTPEPELQLNLRTVLPEDYISDSFERVAIYRRLLNAASDSELTELRAELADRFGQPPPALDDLFRVARVRLLARQAGIARVELAAGRITITRPDGKTESFTGDINTLLTWLERTVPATGLSARGS